MDSPSSAEVINDFLWLPSSYPPVRSLSLSYLCHSFWKRRLYRRIYHEGRRKSWQAGGEWLPWYTEAEQTRRDNMRSRHVPITYACARRVCSFLVAAMHRELDLYYIPTATQLTVAGSFSVNKVCIKSWQRATAANGSVINSVTAKNTHPVAAACVKYRIKWLITASFCDVIMENSLTCGAKWGVGSLSSSIQIIFNKTGSKHKQKWTPSD